MNWQTLKKQFHKALWECKPIDWYEEKWWPEVESLLEQEEKRGVGKDWLKIDIKDINTIIGLLKGGVENQKIINFIKSYIYEPK